jgi:hypothetical protein
MMCAFRTVEQGTAPSHTADEAPKYDLTVRVLPDDGLMEVSGTIELPPTDSSRDHVELSLSELMHDVSVDILSPSSLAGHATIESRIRPQARAGWGTNTWIVRPGGTTPPGTPITLKVRYRGGGPRTSEIFSINRISAFAAGIKTAWYPEIEDGPVASSGELRGVRGTGTLRFVVPRGFTVYAPGEPAGPSTFTFVHPIFFSFATARYHATSYRAAPRPVSGYTLRSRPAMATYLDSTRRVLDVLAKEFGPYPNAQFAVAEVPAAQADSAGFEGASLEGLVLASSVYLDRPFNVAYFGHELSHQWWPNLVASKTIGGGRLMLSEGLAQYGSLRAVETLDGPAAAERYRRTGFPGFEHYGAVSYLRLAAAGYDAPLTDLPADNTVARALVLNKGMLVWDMLSRNVGRERFRDALQQITREYAHSRIAWTEFLAIVQRHADHDLSLFFAAWFDRLGAPQFELTWRRAPDGTLLGTVSQPTPSFAASIEVEARGDSGRSRSYQEAIDSARRDFSLRPGFRVRELVLDPHHAVLRWDATDRADAEGLAPYTRVMILMDQGRGSEAEEALHAYFAHRPSGDTIGLPFMMHFAHGEYFLNIGQYAEAQLQTQQALAERVRRPDALPLVFAQLAAIGYARHDVSLTKSAADSASAADAALGGRTGAGVEARRLVKALVNSLASP